MFGLLGVSDGLSLVPVISAILPSSKLSNWIGFLYFFRLTSVFQVFQLQKFNELINPVLLSEESSIALHLNETTFLIARLVFSITLFLLISSGIVFATAYGATTSMMPTYLRVYNDIGSISWLDAFYYVVVTGDYILFF
jgi:hypothetical protein